MKNELIYNELIEQPAYAEAIEQPATDGEYSFAALMAMTVGLLSVLAAGGTVSGEMAELLPLVSAAAAPGLVAWVLSYLSANSAMEEQEVPVLG